MLAILLAPLLLLIAGCSSQTRPPVEPSAADAYGLHPGAPSPLEGVIGKTVTAAYHDYIVAVKADYAAHASRARLKFLSRARDTLTPRFLQAIRTNDKACSVMPGEIPADCVDSDPLLCAQDSPETANGTAKVESVSIFGAKAMVRLRLCYQACQPAKRTNDWGVDVFMSQRGERWLIDDVHCDTSAR